MNQPVRKSRVTYRVEILALRSLELADRVAAGSSALSMAWTCPYSAAEWAGLPEAVGDDVVQATAAAPLCQCEAANMTGVFRYVLHRDVAERLAGAGADAARPTTIGQSADAVVRRLLRRW
jgi:hypothetical protein